MMLRVRDFILGLGVGAAAAILVWLFYCRRLLKRRIDELKAAAPKPVAKDYRDNGTIRFLYEQRLTLFNTRRDHEWKIIFGAVALLGAADWALLTKNLPLNNCYLITGWVVCCIAVCLIVVAYQNDLQSRNRRDRQAMDALYNCLCDQLAIDPLSPARARIPGDNTSSGRWAFWWQVALLALATLVSMALPFVLNKNLVCCGAV